MPSLVIDIREACRPHRTGKGQWTFHVVQELLRQGLELTLFSDAPIPPPLAALHPADVRIFPSGLRWHLHAARALLRMGRTVDAYVSPTSFIVPAMLGRRVRCVPVVHDLIAFQPGLHQRKARMVERLCLPRALRCAAAVCVLSEATRRDLLARFPRLDASRLQTVFAGPMEEDPPLSEPDGRTVLCVGTLCPRKNQLRLIRAYASLPAGVRERTRLVLGGGRGWHDEEIVAAAAATPGVSWCGYMTDAQYRDALHSCTVFALPSFYEGFGMQILDALQRGIPVLTSAQGSLAEVAGSAAVFVQPDSVEDIARGLALLLHDAVLRASLRERGPVQAQSFSWQATAQALLASVRSFQKLQ